MALGAQWYIPFNVIAGASAIPTDLRELASQFCLPWRQKWRQLILPAIFPFYVTGGITAAGGAWNASIVSKEYSTPEGAALPVLQDINFELREGEIVALLGKSGSGKAILLRCIAGLLAPTSGTVCCRGAPVNGANPGVAMVFQTFALLPWLTVRANVEMGLEHPGPSSTRLSPTLRSRIDRV